LRIKLNEASLDELGAGLAERFGNRWHSTVQGVRG
jgi:hypothetical protein